MKPHKVIHIQYTGANPYQKLLIDNLTDLGMAAKGLRFNHFKIRLLGVSILNNIKKWKPHVKLRVSNFTDIAEKVVPFFEKHQLYGNKQKAFKVFADIVKHMQSGAHLKEETLDKLKGLVKILNSLNKKGL